MKTIYIYLFSQFLLCTFASAQVEEGLLAHFSFDEELLRSDKRFFSPVNTKGDIHLMPGVVNNALVFDGSNQELTMPGTINDYLSEYQRFSLSFYFRADDLSQTQSLMGKRHRCNYEKIFDIQVGDELRVYLFGKPQVEKGIIIRAAIPDQQWHHYVFVREINGGRLYVDGRLVDYQMIPYDIPIRDRSPFGISNSPCQEERGWGNLKGGLDELKLYDGALNEDDIWWLYRALRHKQQQANATETSAPAKPKKDSRINQIFGNYQNSYPDVKSQLVLEPKHFTLIIQNPEQYKGVDQLTFSGNYKIKAGQLYLLGNELTLSGPNGQKQETYTGPQIIGEIYGEVNIDLNAFDLRMKLEKKG